MTVSPLLGVLGFAAVIALVMLRMPVALAMGSVGFVGLMLASGIETSGFMLGRTTFEAVFPYSLSVVPLFIAMGVFAGHAGLSQSLYSFVAAIVGHLRGGLAMATVGGCAIFGAVSGSGIATTATMGRVKENCSEPWTTFEKSMPDSGSATYAASDFCAMIAFACSRVAPITSSSRPSTLA